VLNAAEFCQFRTFTFRKVYSAATHLRRGGQCGKSFIANFLQNRAVKEFWKSANICQSYEQMYSGTVFLTHCVVSTILWQRSTIRNLTFSACAICS